MNSYKPFIEDPASLARLVGQQYVVLRPGGSVPLVFRRLQTLLKRHLEGSTATFPAEPHVTLAGFAAESRHDELPEMLAAWGRDVVPLHLQIEGICAFPAPFQILAIRIRKSAELFHSLASLRDFAARQELTLVTALPVTQWIFHLTLADCAAIPREAWDQAVRCAEQIPLAVGTSSTVHEAEIVTFDRGGERSGGTVSFARS
jgi:2'-5' RNA ligase